ncbi:MAG: hypothetical protein JKX94_13015 [Sneathiella sp.]|nr:hypothetical protein [Sneathiella sp.]
MTKPTRLSAEIQSLLLPRKPLPWTDVKGFMSPWAKQVIIENDASRAFLSSIHDQEQDERSIIRDQVEGAITGLSSKSTRFWMAEYTFMAKFLTIDQLISYAPAFVKLAYSMPIKLVSVRRLVVRKYLASIIPYANDFMLRQQRKFCRSSVLFYPSDLLFTMADRFSSLMKRSVDQSMSANRKRVLMSVRSLQIMSDNEVCERFRTEEEYLTELAFLQTQCRYYRIDVSEIYHITGKDLRQFWTF